jgi:FkbM family methyltransferase
MEFSEHMLKRRIAALLPARSADARRSANGIRGNDPDLPQAVDISDLPPIPGDEGFLREAYRRILGRECDVSGFVNYLELLKRHVPRRVILLQLINSEEGTRRGIRFTGIQEIGPSTRRRPGLFSIRASAGRLGAVLRDLIRRILFTRFDSIDHKLEFLLREVTARTDTVVAKADVSFVSLSQKLDAYVANLSEENRRGREELAQQSNQALELRRSMDFAQELLARVELRTSALGRDLASQVLRLDHSIGALKTDLEALRVRLDEATGALGTSVTAAAEEARRGVAGVNKTIQANTSAVIDEQRRALDSIQSIGAANSAAAAEAKQGMVAISKVIQANTSAMVEEQRRAVDSIQSITAAHTAAAEEAKRGVLAVNRAIQASTSAMVEEQRGALNSIQSSAAANSEATLASLADVFARIRPPVISGGADILVTEVAGMIVGVPGNEWRMAAYHAFRGVMEPGLTKYFCTLIKPGTVVVDVGANVGIYTLLAAKLLEGTGKIYSFEPTPRIYEILRDNVQVNSFLELGIVHLHQLAVTDISGKARFSIFNNDSGHNTLFHDGKADDEIDVTTISLDEILATQERVDIVKIDAEGAEPLILRGMQQVIKRNPKIRILLEFAPVHLIRAGSSPLELLDEFASFGFGIRRIDDVNGDLLSVTRGELAEAFSVNLQLELLRQTRTNG